LGELLLARSIQIYDFNTDKSVAQIKRTWAGVVEEDPGAGQRNSMAGTAGGSFRIQHTDGTLNYTFTLMPENNMLILQGSSSGRSIALRYLADKIEHAKTRDVISEKRLKTNDMINLFHRIIDEDNDSIIQKLTLFFEPQLGFTYSKETYGEISYRFTENRCASKHIDFAKLHQNSKAMDMVLKIKKCTGLNEDGTVRLDVTRRCTFRMYRDVEADDWDMFCSTILGFLWQ